MSTNNGNWQTCVVDNDYEINTEYPYIIRRRSNQRIVSEFINHKNGYTQLTLNSKKFYKHRVIASQFIQNDQPERKTEVDHINHDRTDYHLENLRWVTHTENILNRTSTRGVDYEFIDYEDVVDDDLVEVRDYGSYQFEDYYYSPDNNLFYFDTGVNLRVLHINFDKRNGRGYVCARSKDGINTKISFTKFKKLYGFD